MNVDKLKPFTLYQFKVRAIKHDANQTSLYSESIECYTNEDGENSIVNCLIEQYCTLSGFHFRFYERTLQFLAKSKRYNGSWVTIRKYELHGRNRAI